MIYSNLNITSVSLLTNFPGEKGEWCSFLIIMSISNMVAFTNRDSPSGSYWNNMGERYFLSCKSGKWSSCTGHLPCGQTRARITGWIWISSNIQGMFSLVVNHWFGGDLDGVVTRWCIHSSSIATEKQRLQRFSGSRYLSCTVPTMYNIYFI